MESFILALLALLIVTEMCVRDANKSAAESVARLQRILDQMEVRK